MGYSPLISVIIPVYNVQHFIVPCIKSVLDQDLDEPIEIIVVDDCTPDNSICLAKKLVCKSFSDNRNVIFLRHEHNKGQAAARNTGIRRATGKFLFFLDSDDFLPIDSFSKLLSHTIDTNIDIIEGQCLYVSENGKYLSNNKLIDKKEKIITDENLWKIGQLWMPVCWNKLIDRDYFITKQMWFAEGFYYEDLYWSFLVAFSNPKIKTTPQITYNYTIRENSTTHTISKKHVDSFVLLVERLYLLCKRKGMDHKYKRRILSNYEIFRSIAIDYVYPNCDESDCKYLFRELTKFNIQSFIEMLSNDKMIFKHKFKILPLYLGILGHPAIKLKSKITNFFK